uniref:arginine decarboxylase-like n=1 Tax=Erigeron canadensis TaxID=72917 RepID=UPI001CB8FF75|nr:arginine decarboxylase-like [Erigeron canadensis]
MCSTSTTKRACSTQERNYKMTGKKDEKMGLPNNANTAMNNMTISDSKNSENHKQPQLVTILKALAQQKVATFQFPGHNRGRAAPSSLSDVIGVQPFLHDISMPPEIGSLFALEGPIWNAQKKAAELFGATQTWFLVGGTTCGIQASIMATCSPGDILILPRNAHKSTFSSMVLSGAIPKYITSEYDSDWDIVGSITPSQVEEAIQELDDQGLKASAILITSPTYHGICSNLEKISLLCHSHNIPIIVDEAHGAHLGFHEKFPQSALNQGVDISIQSTHKILSSLTQSSMLHMSGKLVDRERLCQCLQSLQSTSASYLLLASLDAARAQLSGNPKTIFNKAVEIAMEAKNFIEKIPGITVLNCDDPLRITIGVWKLGISGFVANEILYEEGVIAELSGTRSLTFAINLGTTRDDVMRLVSGLRHISETYDSLIRANEKGSNDVHIKAFLGTTATSGMILSPREAFFASKTSVSCKDGIGKVCGELVCPYPPGIPLLIPGEVITEEALSYVVEVLQNGGFVSGAADPGLSTIVICVNPA